MFAVTFPSDLENFSVRKSVRFIRFYIVLMIFRVIRVYTNYVRPYDVLWYKCMPWYRYSTTINAEALAFSYHDSLAHLHVCLSFSYHAD